MSRTGTARDLPRTATTFFLMVLACPVLLGAGIPVFTLPLDRSDRSELEFEIDPYYTSLDLTLGLTGQEIPIVREKNELSVYRILLLSVIPRFVVLEGSLNPLPCLGLAAREYLPDFYHSADMDGDFNLIQSFTAGFAEPYAVSLFLGNVVKFADEGTDRPEGRGYAGTLVSAGNWHIKDNRAIADRWIEAEVKIKGERSSPDRKISWSFRLGTRLHEHPEIRDLFYFGISRDRTDPGNFRFAIFENSSLETRLDLSLRKARPVRLLLLAGKKFPLRRTRIIPGVKLGFLWEARSQYTGSLAAAGWSSDLKFIINPTIGF